MIKFFRGTRLNLLKTGQSAGYFKYAIGEIILVVIGILIALQINNWNLEAKNQEKINSIFQEIMSDLSDDIPEVDRVIKFYKRKDSLTNLVLTNQITAKDYEEVNPYFSLVLNRRAVKVNSNGFENLMLQIDKIPEGHEKLVAQLKSVYNRDRKRIEEFQLNTATIIDQILENYANNYDWFSLSEERYREDWIDYQLNNPKYKNEVRLYKIIAVENLLLGLNQFRNDAIRSYVALHKKINPNKAFPDFIPPKG